MGRMSWAIYLWPGLPRLWRRGAWSGLAVAVGFALLLNVALVSSLVWTEIELLGAGNRSLVWLVVAIVWVGSATLSLGGEHRNHRADQSPDKDESFCEVLDQYLQQNWYEAQRGLTRLLRRNPRNTEARLMLANVLRRSGRLDEAAGQLDRLSRIEGSQQWEHEIRQQRQWLAKAACRAEEEEEHAANDLPESEKVAA